jgi:hypothetical protein
MIAMHVGGSVSPQASRHRRAAGFYLKRLTDHPGARFNPGMAQLQPIRPRTFSARQPLDRNRGGSFQLLREQQDAPFLEQPSQLSQRAAG